MSISKTVLIFCVSAMPLVVTTSQVPKKQEKNLTVTLPESDWVKVMYVIRQSNGPYPVVTQVQEMLLKQLNDTSKTKK